MSQLQAADPETPGLGDCLRSARRGRGLTLKQVSERTGVAVSTLSKVENHQMTLTYDKLLQISRGLEIDISELFHSPYSDNIPKKFNRRSVSRRGEGQVIRTKSYNYLYQHTDLLGKQMSPIIAEMNARTIEEFGPMMRHEGEEYLLVIEGKIMVHTEVYAPVELNVGDSIFIDSTMAHAYLNVGDGVARAVCVCSASSSALMEALRLIENREAASATKASPERGTPGRPVKARR
ncbi:helix-turn-helix domain-containing protein [Methylobacterium frigidaeris]|uniref:HTH cro/C1-type domain-containing protein n=1 Tax=Methylobacterium frigidaeris TaxID=2038277 RepID=A0AA37HHQ4_9HYPH|nr:XRE family transcriptional regulator [Methylobacterium frigidaeris]GJD66342.1 hypothetical protein MPEAHAMD_6539 [Methylobacterium frigidaeris]